MHLQATLHIRSIVETETFGGVFLFLFVVAIATFLLLVLVLRCYSVGGCVA